MSARAARRAAFPLLVALVVGLVAHASYAAEPVAATPGDFESDDFDAPALDLSRWSAVDPRGDGTLTTVGAGSGDARLSMEVPAGVSHDAWVPNNSLRLVQAVDDADFEVEAKFDSTPTARFQMHGLTAAQADGSFVRFGVHHTGSGLRLYAATVTASAGTKRLDIAVAAGAAARLRLTRSGDTWTLAYAAASGPWTTAGAFTHALEVASAGVFAGNATSSGAPPAYTALVDYAFNTAAPIDPEDGPGGPTTTTSTSTTTTSTTTSTTTTVPPPGEGPDIDVWYGDEQSFGALGQPQMWVNVLGNVSDPDGVTSLGYTLNGGPSRPLSRGPDLRRLYGAGDFNVEIDYGELAAGVNTVVITAVDGDGDSSTETVTVNRVAGTTWPLPYSTDWASATSISQQAQVVDGNWALQGNGTIRAVEPGYDRTVAIGDLSWTDYQVTVPVTVHGLSPGYGTGQSGGPLFGLGLRWRGHTAVGAEQPRRHWYPTGAFAWYRWESWTGYRLSGNGGAPSAQFANPPVQFGTTYVFKAQVRTVAGGSEYRFKAWASGTPEPAAWARTIVDGDGPASGGVLLISHHVVADWGDVVVTPIAP